MQSARRMLGPLHLAGLRERLATSFWAVPVTAVSLAIALALGLSELDRHIHQQDAWFVFGGEPESARELLSTIASALLTITGLVFSITILVLQLASSQFSPRVLRTFLQDRITKVSMGVFVGSFVYALVLLPRVRNGNAHQAEFVPALAVFVAFVLSIVSVTVLIRYIHHMAHSLRAVQIMRRIAQETRRCLDKLYSAVAEDERPGACDRGPTEPPDRRFEHDGRAGVLMNVNERTLLELANERDLVIGMVSAVGQFVPSGAPLFEIWGQGRVEAHELAGCVTFGAERTPNQDPAFGLRQLVDIAERALSPGVNDPTTATQALDHIHDLLRAIGTRSLPGPLVHDQAGTLRLVLPRVDWPAYLRLGVEEIRHYGRDSVQVVRRMRTLLTDLLGVVPAPRRPVILEQLALLEERREAGGGAHTQLA